MRLYVVIEKICGDPGISLVTASRQQANDRFLKLVEETESPDVPSETELLESSDFDYGDDCCIYIKVVDGDRGNLLQ